MSIKCARGGQNGRAMMIQLIVRRVCANVFIFIFSSDIIRVVIDFAHALSRRVMRDARGILVAAKRNLNRMHVSSHCGGWQLLTALDHESNCGFFSFFN